MKRKMGDRKRTATPNKKTKSDWPSIKPKSNLKITRLKDDDLITVSYPFHIFTEFFLFFFEKL